MTKMGKGQAALTLLVILVGVLLQRQVEAGCAAGGATQYSTQYNGDTGSIQSQLYPNTYPQDQTCNWLIQLHSTTKVVIIEITVMDIYKNDSLTCSQGDYLRIVDDQAAWKVWADNICGNTTPAIITGTSNRAKVTFHASDFGTAGSGFYLRWRTDYQFTAATTESTTTTATTANSGGADATTTTSEGLSTTYLIIIIASSGVVVIGLIGFLIRYCMSKSGQGSVQAISPVSERKQSTVGMHERGTMRYEKSRALETSSAPYTAAATTTAWKPGSNLAPAPVKAAPKAEEEKVEEKVPPHIMISYQWDVKPEVLEFRERLADAGYRVWIDVEQMHKGTSTFESMAKAVENSAVVIPVLTKAYQDSINCRKEIEYADKRKRTLMPICMQKDYKVAGWLDFIIGGATSHTLCDEDCYDEELEKFFEKVKVVGKAAKIEEEGEE